MSHKKTYRKDKTCLNCGFVVEQKFCPNCGQENIDIRKSFHHLFIHFFEDLTHYENAFWRTIKNLLFKPASLTKEYLSGKRLSFLAPVRLYIFISFLTFFMLAIIPGPNFINKLNNSNNKNAKENLGEEVDYDYDSDSTAVGSQANKTTIELTTAKDLELEKIMKLQSISDSTKQKLQKIILEAGKAEKSKKNDFAFWFKDVKELDEAKAKGKINYTTHWFLKKFLKISENNTSDELLEKANESAKHNFPKVLIIYMPLFAFFLWIFQNKKRWYYFDHGIFTLHYFSFLLLIYLLIFTSGSLLDLLKDNFVTSFLEGTIKTLGFGWMFYYFFPAHHRFYGESRRKSFLKGMLLFFINMFFILVFLVFFFLFTILNIK